MLDSELPRLSVAVTPEIHLALKIEATKRRVTVQSLVKAECQALFARVLAEHAASLK